MCQKANTMKQFFVLLNHPPPLQKPIVIGVVNKTFFTDSIYDVTRNTNFLTANQVKDLGFKVPPQNKSYLVPIEIPRDWFIH
jgi:hypothetical protein